MSEVVKKGTRKERRIMKSYTIAYVPEQDAIYLQT